MAFGHHVPLSPASHFAPKECARGLGNPTLWVTGVELKHVGVLSYSRDVYLQKSMSLVLGIRINSSNSRQHNAISIQGPLLQSKETGAHTRTSTLHSRDLQSSSFRALSCRPCPFDPSPSLEALGQRRTCEAPARQGKHELV